MQKEVDLKVWEKFEAATSADDGRKKKGIG